jgi:hypothetical protein
MGIPSSVNPLFLGAAAQAEEGGYLIERSLRFNSADSAYLSAGLSTFTSRTVGTVSFWFKAAKLGVDRVLAAGWDGGVSYSGSIQLASDNILFVGVGGDLEYGFRTTAVFRDPSAWYHVVVAWDRSAAAADKVKVWVNNVAQTSTDAGYQSWTSGNCQIFCPNTSNRIGRGDGDRYGNYLDGYLGEYFFIDGQALDPTSFGEFSTTTGVWVPIEYTGTYGAQGWRLDFSDNSAATASTLGADRSGNGNNWTPNNLSVTAGAGNDSLIDVPVNGAQTDTGAGGEVRGNYCTLNPLVNASAISASAALLSDGNLRADGNGANSTLALSTFGLSSGKWYVEITANSDFSADSTSSVGLSALSDTGAALVVYRGDGSTFGGLGTFNTYTTNNVISMSIDMDNKEITYRKNNTIQGTGAYSFVASVVYVRLFLSGSGTKTFTANFGQRPFAYTAPSGFKALNTANLPAPTITQPSTVMDVALWTGNGGSTQTISGLGFSPDFVWIKSRTNAEIFISHWLFDTVRGVEKGLISNLTSEEITDSRTLTSFNSDGFSLGNNALNLSSIPYVGWAWDAGSSTVTNTDGSISSQVRANVSAGFSVVTYTGNGTDGATVGHGLGVAPGFIIIKQRVAGPGSDLYNWNSYHSSLGATKFIALNTTDAANTLPLFNNTAPTSSVFSLGSSSGGFNNVNNASGVTYVAYCFAPVEGYSAFGSYTGNGSADGPFIFTGMRPRWILIRSTSSSRDWLLYDTARGVYNENVEGPLQPNTSGTAYTNSSYTPFDMLSNGFKPRAATTNFNASGETHIYAAFAESPFQYSRAR